MTRETRKQEDNSPPGRRRVDFRFVLRFRGQLLGVVAVGVAASVFEAVGLALFISILDGMRADSTSSSPMGFVSQISAGWPPATRLRIVATVLVLVYALKGLMIYFNGILGARLDVSATKYQMMRCYRRLLGAKLAYVNAQRGSYWYTILRQHVTRFGQVLRVLAEAIPPFFTFVALLALLVLVSWKMTLLAFGFALLASLPVQGLQRRGFAAGRGVAVQNGLTDAVVLDTISGLKVIHLFSRSADTLRRLDRDMDTWGQRLVDLAKVVSATNPLYETTSIAGLALLLVLGSFWLRNPVTGALDMEVMLAFLVIFYRMMPAVSAMNRVRVSMSTLLPVCEEVQRFLDQSDDHQVVGGSRIWTSLHREIEFRNVSFAYDASRGRVLDRVSFRIPRGGKVGIVGASGGGKSTLGELLLHFYDPDDGAILVDDVDLRDIELISWRRRIGVVTQETFLFNDTIEANIGFALAGAGRDAIERAARQAHVHDFVMQLPLGYDTVIGDRGVLLSGGQRQRIAIARAILSDPEILLLDEATSSLDSESEKIVQKALDELSESRTVIAIAHRLSTITNSDVVFVMEGGRIVEQGTHATLVARPGGVYRRLAELQSLDQSN